ncbi:MAG: D-2-hydroxyacid dehydrogenase, partial [Planctomycetaceae bacterium]|nr:D-2-hydroxyacid dehydrogenase [Planctomycetaceae bacterium]
MKKRVVLCFPVTHEQVAELDACSDDIEVVNAGQTGIAHEILNADIFVGHAKVPVPWNQVVRQGRLKWIQSSAAGLDHCLQPEVIDSDIVVSSVSGLFANQVAEQTMALLFGVYRSSLTFFRASEKREFVRRPTLDFHGQTVGIIGF